MTTKTLVVIVISSFVLCGLNIRCTQKPTPTPTPTPTPVSTGEKFLLKLEEELAKDGELELKIIRKDGKVSGEAGWNCNHPQSKQYCK